MRAATGIDKILDSAVEEKPAPKPVSTRKPFAGLGSVKTTTATSAKVSEDGEIIETNDETQAGISSGEDRGEAEPSLEELANQPAMSELPAEPEEAAAPAPKPAVKSIFSKAG